MYRLMKSERFSLGGVSHGSASPYHQIEVARFHDFSDALAACNSATRTTGIRHYILSHLSQEYINGAWID